METPPPYGQTLATVAAGRTAAVAQLRQLANRLEALALEDVVEVLTLIEPVSFPVKDTCGARLRRGYVLIGAVAHDEVVLVLRVLQWSSIEPSSGARRWQFTRTREHRNRHAVTGTVVGSASLKILSIVVPNCRPSDLLLYVSP
jgi:hypothetical protein